jgi:hypothetical protein
MKAARARLILRRNESTKGLRARTESWPEFHEVCDAIVALDIRLGAGVRFIETRDSAQ